MHPTQRLTPPGCSLLFFAVLLTSPPQEANPKPDLKKPSGASTSLVASGLPFLGWTYDDLIACLLVERLLQLQLFKAFMLTHFMPSGVTAQQLAARLPERVQSALSQQVAIRRASDAVGRRSSANAEQQQQQQQQQQREDAGVDREQAADQDNAQDNEQDNEKDNAQDNEQPDMDWMAFAVAEDEDISDISCAPSLLGLSGRSMLLPLQQQAVAAAGERHASSFVMERSCSLLVPSRSRLPSLDEQ
jgi:hypothetical protein